jgi:hypothetical protein
MNANSARFALICLTLGTCFVWAGLISSQERLLPPTQTPGEMPKGVEVQARGPVHEAFASPLTEPTATPTIAKKPPAPIEEMPPEEKPEGEVVWIGGYFAWDDDRSDFLWVSGCWRVKPVGKEWVPGYWREVNERWQWVPGFWANAPQEAKAAPITYYPAPPAPPNVAPPGDPPGADMLHVPGYWMWTGDRYFWRAGYWTRVRPGYVYVASHYRWTPYGYVFVPGYWDYTVARRGVLYAPITVDMVVVGPRYVYTPYYAVRDTIVLDTLFVRASYGAYYFGDYYGPRYVSIGFEPCIVYSRRHYEPIIVYERWHHRGNPRWHDTQVTLVIDRGAGRAPVPPRTLVQQTTIIKNTTNVTNVTNVIAPTKTVVLGQGNKVVPLDTATRTQVAKASLASQQTLAADRRKTETASTSSGPITKPRTSGLTVTPTPPVSPKTTIGSTPPLTKDLGKLPAPMDAGKKTAPPLDGKGTTKDVGKLPMPTDAGKKTPSFDGKSTTKDAGKLPTPTDASKKGPPPIRDGGTIRDGAKTPPPRDRPIDPKRPDDKKKKG